MREWKGRNEGVLLPGSLEERKRQLPAEAAVRQCLRSDQSANLRAAFLKASIAAGVDPRMGPAIFTCVTLRPTKFRI